MVTKCSTIIYNRTGIYHLVIFREVAREELAQPGPYFSVCFIGSCAGILLEVPDKIICVLRQSADTVSKTSTTSCVCCTFVPMILDTGRQQEDKVSTKNNTKSVSNNYHYLYCYDD